MKKRPFIKAGLQISNRGKADITVENIYFLLPRIFLEGTAFLLQGLTYNG